MKAVVTGGAGFTGAHVVRELVNRDYEVSVLDVTQGDPGVQAEFEARGVRFVVGSVSDAATLDRVVPGHELIFNLASAFRDIHQGTKLFQQVDVEGTRLLLAVARREGVRRVIHCSTQGVHGSLPAGAVPGNEDSPFAPLDEYCAAKVDAERVCQGFIDEGMDIVLLRPTSIYGPGDTHGWLKLFRLCRKGRFPMIGTGETFNHPVYVESLAKAFVAAAEAPAVNGGTFIIGDDKYLTLNELVRLVGHVQGRKVRILRFPWFWPVRAAATIVEGVTRPFGVEPPIFHRRLNWYVTNRGWDLSRAKAALGYVPAVSLEEGLRRTMHWYQERGLL